EATKARRAKYEAWKKGREAKKALGEAKAKAMALAGKSAPAPPAEAPTKPTGQLNRAALNGLGLKGLPLKPEFTKSMTASMDDSVETKRKLEKLGDMPAIDMTMNEGEASVGDLEVDDDDEEANRMDQAMRKKKSDDAMDVDEDDVDPLDAFMSGVKEQVQKVNLEDLKKLGNLSGRQRLDEGADDEDFGVDDAAPDELDATDLNPEDIWH
ncbi:hypothetical protein MPER_04385, partial [Moniliophthora perniciosa FA553]